MLKELLLLALAALCVSDAMHISGKTADMDFLHKQKKIYEMMFFVKQNTLTDTEFYEIGHSYDIENNIDMYKDKVQYCWSFLNLTARTRELIKVLS